MQAALYFVYTEYAAFGRTGQNHVQLDNSNWAKLLNTAPGLVGHQFPTSEIDLVFTKARKTDRKLSFANFLLALQMVAGIKYAELDPITGFGMLCGRHLFGVLSSDEDASAGTVPKTSTRVMNALLGRDRTYEKKASTPKSGGEGLDGTGGGAGDNRSASRFSRSGQISPAQVSLRTSSMHFAGEANAKGSIFDKLTNEDTYTGVYKNLKKNGVSGGINGYDGDISGNIRELNTMTRPEMVRSKFMEM